MQKFLWWKKYLTKMQMIQFVVFFVHALQPLFIECHYPKVMTTFLVILNNALQNATRGGHLRFPACSKQQKRGARNPISQNRK